MNSTSSNHPVIIGSKIHQNLSINTLTHTLKYHMITFYRIYLNRYPINIIITNIFHKKRKRTKSTLKIIEIIRETHSKTHKK